MPRRKIKNTTIDQDAQIDKLDLVNEMEVHAQMFAKWAGLLEQAQGDRDDAKDELELIAADFDSAIRAEPEDYGIERVTEGAIKSAILTQDQYREVKRKILDAERRVNAYTAAVRTMEHRKRMLEKMADLWLGGYYSENMANRSAAQQKKGKETQTKIKKGLSKGSKLKRRRS